MTLPKDSQDSGHADLRFDTERAADTAAADPPQPPPAGWLPDLSERHQYRYWDGTAWTDQVRDGDTTSSDPLTRRQQWYRRKGVLIASAVAAVVLISGTAAVLTLVGSRGGTTSTRPPSTSITPRTTITQAPTPTTLKAALAQWVIRWYAQLKEFQDAVAAMQRAGQNQDLAGVSASCQRLHDTVSVGWQSLLPTPDPALTAALQSAIDDIHDAAHSCMSAAATLDQKDMDAALSYMSQAEAHIQTVAQILSADMAGS